jgi:adenylate kinase family enzyme
MDEGGRDRRTRILIVGNGGSGKSFVAKQVSSTLALPVVHLDDLHWMPGQYGVARDKQEVAELTRAEAEAERWIIEGVYGWLAKIALPRATTLVWLDIAEAECVDNIRRRGIQGGGSAADFEGLLKWVSEYRVRTNSNSYTAHEGLYPGFEGEKFRLTDRREVDAFLAEMADSGSR